MSSARVKAGDVLGGKYRVERVLGQGGMGMVVAARHVQLGQRVALKFMLKEALTEPAHAERFAREARAAVQLQSVHTAKVLDVGKLKNGEPYMVMEYLEGKDLDAVLRDARGPLSTRSHIQLAVPPDVKSAEGLRIIVDGLEVPPKQYDGYVFRAPNDHEVVVIAKGRKNVRIPAKNRQLVAVSLGEIDRSPPAPPAVVPPPSGDKTPPPPPPPAEPDSGGGWPTMKWVGLAMMGAGVGAGVVGLVKNIDFLDKRSTYQDQYQQACKPIVGVREECTAIGDDSFFENPDALDVRAKAEANDRSTRLVLPIAYISAAALFGVGLYFFLTTESTKRSETNAARLTVTPHVGPRDGGLSVVGTF